jgi:hypothetical protein
LLLFKQTCKLALGRGDGNRLVAGRAHASEGRQQRTVAAAGQWVFTQPGDFRHVGTDEVG